MPSTDRDLDALKQEQRRIAEEVRIEDDLPATIETVAGFDVAYGEGTCYGALVLLELDGLETQATLTAPAPLELPYIPGLLAYRELPALEAVWEIAKARDLIPDVLLVDGGGLIHPRRVGSACHAGVRYDLPTIGITKSLLLGEIHGELAAYGDVARVEEDGEHLGIAYRSSRRAKHPIYVSPGHRTTPTSALAITRRCCTGDRKLPEPVHRAHVAAGQARDEAERGG